MCEGVQRTRHGWRGVITGRWTACRRSCLRGLAVQDRGEGATSSAMSHLLSKHVLKGYSSPPLVLSKRVAGSMLAGAPGHVGAILLFGEELLQARLQCSSIIEYSVHGY